MSVKWSVSWNRNENWFRLPRLSQEPRRRRGDAGHRPRGGARAHADAADADVLVVNTCAFIDSAKQESIDAILEMAQQKRDGSCTRLVVTGCLAERYRDELKKEIPEIDAVLGTGEVPEIVDAIGRRRSSAIGARRCGPSRSTLFTLADFAVTRTHARSIEPRIAERRSPTPTLPTYLYDADTPRLLTTPRHYAYVKIAEGCDYTCAFCIIPTLRGQYRSRTADSIVREARGARRARRAGAAAHLAGHDLLRHRPRRARRAGAAAARAERDRRPRAGSGCSTSTRRRSPTTCSTRWPSARRSAATSTCRCSTRRRPC